MTLSSRFWRLSLNCTLNIYLLHRGDSSAPLGQSARLSHTLLRFTHILWPGHCHCQLGHRKGWVGQSLSSLLSRQSLSPSQTQAWKMQFPLSQRKKEGGQVLGGHLWCSSEPSTQSGWPSHSQLAGIQLPSDWHWNSVWWHIPGGLVAGSHIKDAEIILIVISQPPFILSKQVKGNQTIKNKCKSWSLRVTKAILLTKCWPRQGKKQIANCMVYLEVLTPRLICTCSKANIMWGWSSISTNSI